MGAKEAAEFDVYLIALNQSMHLSRCVHGPLEMDSPGVLANNANLWTPLRTLLGLLSKVQNMDLEQFLKFSQSQESPRLLFLDLQPALLSQHSQQSSGVCPVNERPGYF